MFDTTEPTISLLEDCLYYDDGLEGQYSNGKWCIFPVKGIISPCNDWF